MKMIMSIALLVLVAAAQRVAADGAAWVYDMEAPNGPPKWKDIGYPTCEGQSQSPVDITNVQLNTLGSLVFTNYAVEQGLFRLFNNGHCAEVEVDDSLVATVTGAGLPGTYLLDQYHFHFGSSDNVGSEHTVDSQAYPMEIHLVHYSTNYPDFTTATADPIGIAVLGVFVKIGAFNAALEPLISQMPTIAVEGAETYLAAFPIEHLLPADKGAYYRYTGGLTTPGCSESALWTIFKYPIEISAEQMANFRGLSVVNNFRPTQQLNSRVIELNL